MRVHSSTALTKFSQEWLSCLARFAIGLTRLVILSTRACHPQRSEGPAFGKPRAAVPTGAVEAQARLLVGSAISRTRVCAPHKIRRASLRRGRRGHLHPNPPNPRRVRGLPASAPTWFLLPADGQAVDAKGG